MAEGSEPGAHGAAEAERAVARGEGAVREAALVLAAEGLPARVGRRDGRAVLLVPARDAEAAEQALAAYVRENREAAAAEAAPPAPARSAAASGPRWAEALGLALAGAILGAFALTGPAEPGSALLEAASAQAGRIRGGEIARVVTALGLHADLGHALGNALAGGLFTGLLARRLGAGLAVALALAAGALGNGANALLRDAAHVSVGASTAVFGAVGLLAGCAAREGAPRRRRRLRSPLVPVGAGFALLAFLGGGGVRVDLGAHLAGFAAGVLLALPAARLSLGPTAQALATAAAGAVLAGAWTLALS